MDKPDHSPKGTANQIENQTLLKTLKNDRILIMGALERYQTKQNNNHIVHLTLVNLAISFILGIFIIQNLTVDKFYEDLNSAYTVIKGLQKSVSQQVITKIEHSDENSYCKSSFGYFPGTNRGCICPNMQTSNQQCLKPCKIVDATGSQKFYYLNTHQYCIQYEESTGSNALNFIEEVEEGVEFSGNKYKFSRKNDPKLGDFYKIIVAPDKPCFNTVLGQQKQSKLSYPFSTIQYIGCDRYSSWKDDAIFLGETTHGKLMEENNIFTSSLPFYEKYHLSNDPMRIYILRKFSVSQADECQEAIKYKFSKCYVSCLFIQVFELIVCYFSIILFGIGVIFEIIIRTRKILKIKVKPKLTQKIKLTEVLEKSIVLLGILMAVVVIISYIVFQYGLNNQYGLKRTAWYTQRLLNKTCFSNSGILKAIQVVQNAVTECTADIYYYVIFWLIVEIIYLIVGYIVLKNMTAKKQLQY